MKKSRNLFRRVTMIITKASLEEQAKEILKKAEEKGLTSNFFFATTFERYQTQINTLQQLKKAIKDHGTTVTKEYVKGRENLTVNPAISEYNKTATAANGTVTTLIKILEAFAGESDEKDALSEFLDG